MLVVGAETLVRGASNLGASFGLSPIVIGLVIVGFGTSTPELSVGIMSSINGQTELAIGNAIGSNIFNLLMILGLAAVVAPLRVQSQLVLMDVPVMICATLVAAALALNGNLSRIEGACFLAGLIVYTTALIRIGQSEKHNPTTIVDGRPSEDRKERKFTSFLLAAFGLAMLIGGSNLMVDSAIELARYFGVTETVIGLTIVAAGTSFPELVTSIIASIKGQRDLAVGNVIGSNVFNLLGVLGASALVSAEGLNIPESVSRFDFPIAILVAVICWPIFATGREVSRLEGFVLLSGYAAYTVYLFYAAP